MRLLERLDAQLSAQQALIRMCALAGKSKTQNVRITRLRKAADVWLYGRAPATVQGATHAGVHGARHLHPQPFRVG